MIVFPVLVLCRGRRVGRGGAGGHGVCSEIQAALARAQCLSSRAIATGVALVRGDEACNRRGADCQHQEDQNREDECLTAVLG